MKYMGSKNRIAKHLLPIMRQHRLLNQHWVEPFVGGANMIDKVGGPRIGADSNPYLVALLSAVRDGWIPPSDVSRDEYYAVKNAPDDYPPELVGFVGFLCSFGGKWWGGYARSQCGRNYAREGVRNLSRQSPKLAGVDFRCVDYRNLEIPPNSLVYCDPPYKSTTGYSKGIDHDEFFNWCRIQSSAGHTVFVSEYNAPSDFQLVVEIPLTTTLNKNKKEERLERLYRV